MPVHKVAHAPARLQGRVCLHLWTLSPEEFTSQTFADDQSVAHSVAKHGSRLVSRSPSLLQPGCARLQMPARHTLAKAEETPVMGINV